MTEPTGERSFTINTDGYSTVQAIQTITAGGDVTVNFAAQQSFDQSDLRPGRSPGEIERTAELAQLDGWRKEQGDRWAVIVGPGGAGKSTLASQWFDRSESAEPWSGRLWTDLGRGQGFAEVARRAIVQFGAANQEEAERLEESELLRRLLVTLQKKTCLWVLDNLETVLEGRELPADYREFWQQWRSCRGAAGWVLFTSRNLPAGMGTRRIDLAEGFSPEQGARFLRDRGIRGAEAELRAFSAQVHGYPLILGLAAGFLVTQCDADPHLSKLPADFFAIADRHRNDPQATLETVLQWSFERLSPELRDWLGRLCALRVAFAFELEDYPNLLPELAGRSFLIQDCLPLTDPDAPRQFVYRWQPIIQQFVQRQQSDLIEAHRFAIAYHDRRYVDYGKWQTKADIDNYIETWHHEGELAKLTGDRQGEACSHGNQGQGYFYLGRPRESNLHLEKALSIAQGSQDKRGEAITLNRLGNSYSFIGNYQKATEFYRRSLKIIHNDLQIRGSSYGGLGLAYYYLESYEKSLLYHQHHYKISCKVNDENAQATALGNLGNTYISLRKYKEALECHEKSLKIERKILNLRGESSSLNSLGLIYEILDDCLMALNYCEQSLKIRVKISDYPGQAISYTRRGSILLKLDRLPEAQTDFAMARDLFRQLGQHHYAEIAEQNYQRVTQALQTSPSIPTLKPRSPWWVRLWRAWRRWLHRLFDFDRP